MRFLKKKVGEYPEISPQSNPCILCCREDFKNEIILYNVIPQLYDQFPWLYLLQSIPLLARLHATAPCLSDTAFYQLTPHYRLYCLMKFNWNTYILAIFGYIFIHYFETIYARGKTKLSPESVFYKLFNGIHYVGLTKRKSGVRPIEYSWGVVFL